MSRAALLRENALRAERDGDIVRARALFDQAIATAPTDAALLNSAGSFHTRRGAHETAIACYDRAIALRADYVEALVNRAQALAAIDKPIHALDRLRAIEPLAQSDARYWSVRGDIARRVQATMEATICYERSLAIEPSRRVPLAGRARLALERGEDDAVARFDRALAQTPGDAQLWLGKAQALDAAGEMPQALAVAEAIVQHAPTWTDAAELLAQLRWAAGDHADFTDHYRTATDAAPGDVALALSWVKVLAGVGEHRKAAERARIATRHAVDPHPLRLAEAINAGAAGDDQQADRIFETIVLETPDEQAECARHWLRRGRVEAAEHMLAEVTASAPVHVTAWSLRDVAWRLLGDERSEWLHGQRGLISVSEIPIDRDDFEHVAIELGHLHDRAVSPIGQSVRGGTQTRGALFAHHAAWLGPLRSALKEAVDRYQAALPPRDADHPVLWARDRQWRLSHSWSVRLPRAGWHDSHIHPQGLISSAAYMRVPATSGDDDAAGALELGRPPADLRIDLPPLHTIHPRPGHLALFPSTLFHGTRPFAAGERMSVAFDVTPAPSA